MVACTVGARDEDMKKTKKQIDESIRFIPVPKWREVYSYHKTDKRSRQTDVNGKR